MHIHTGRHPQRAHGGRVAAEPGRCSQDTIGSSAYTFAAIKDWTFLFGPGFVVGIGNGLLFGYLMYHPGWCRHDGVLGLIGGPVLIVSAVAVMFGVAQQGGTLQSLCTVPEALWELLLGIYFTLGVQAASTDPSG